MRSDMDLLSSIMGLSGREDTTVAQMALEVAYDIIVGKIAPGQDLNSIEMASRFGLSRTPAREALLLLERHGLVEIPPRKRPRVSDISLETLKEIYHLRGDLYANVARRVAQLADSQIVATLTEHLAAMQAGLTAETGNTFFWANVRFHEAMAVYTGDRTLKRAIDNFGLQVLQLRYRSTNAPSHRVRSFQDHKRLVLAIQENDVELAGALSRSIVLAGLKRLIRLYQAVPSGKKTKPSS